MADEQTTTGTETSATLPRQLESPPRSTGNAVRDFPLIIDWLWQTYLVIKQCVDYINSQINDNPDLDINDLPDPATSTVAQAQQTANQAYVLAQQAKTAVTELDTELTASIADVGARIDGFVAGTFTIAGLNTSQTVTLSPAQPNTNYRVIVQPKSFTGSPANNAFLVKSKSYNTGDFSVTVVAAPGNDGGGPPVDYVVTWEWQLIRNS